MRRVHLRRQLAPPLLALSVSLAYVMIVGVGGSMLLAMPSRDTQVPEPGTVVTTTTTTNGPASAFVTVSGPGDITTRVPANWSRSSASSTLDEVTDPEEPSRLMRYGGAPPTDAQSLKRRIADFDAAWSEWGESSGNDYERIRLESVPFHDIEAVAWEYEHNNDGYRLHCYEHHWMVSGIAYVLYAQSPLSDWETTEPLLERMVESAGPVR